jgi:aspartate-semialdehyde dehydrogenase
VVFQQFSFSCREKNVVVVVDVVNYLLDIPLTAVASNGFSGFGNCSSQQMSIKMLE